MPGLKQIARGLTLEVTPYPSGAVVTIPTIVSYSYTDGQEIETALNGTNLVQSHYMGIRSASITIETSDIESLIAFKTGSRWKDAKLTIEAAAAVDSAGQGVPVMAEQLIVELDNVVVTERGELGRDNQGRGPVTASVTFQLDSPPEEGGSYDPEWTEALVGGGEGSG